MTWREDLILAVAGTFGMVGYVAGEFNGTQEQDQIEADKDKKEVQDEEKTRGQAGLEEKSAA